MKTEVIKCDVCGKDQPGRTQPLTNRPAGWRHIQIEGSAYSSRKEHDTCSDKCFGTLMRGEAMRVDPQGVAELHAVAGASSGGPYR